MVLLDNHSNVNPRWKVCRVSAKVLAPPPTIRLSLLVLLVVVWSFPPVSPDLWLLVGVILELISVKWPFDLFGGFWFSSFFLQF